MIANTPCHGVTIVRWIFIFGIIAFAVPIIMETLRNLWLNWGWSHPYLSTFFVMIVAGLAWWGFGGLMYLSTPREKVPSLKEPVVSIQEPLPLAPIATPDFSDPAYDQFFERSSRSSWQESLVKKGQPLLEQWTTRLDYPEKQRRENESKNWLCEAGEFAGKHLTKEEANQFSLHHNTAASPSKKYDFAIALNQTGTSPGTEDANIAFEILGKVKFLERLRPEPTPPVPTIKSQPEEKPLTGIWLRDECDKWLNSADTAINKLKAQGDRAVPEAKSCIDGIEAFSRRNMSVSDYDKINTDPSIETFHKEKLKLDPSYEPRMYTSILAQRGARLLAFRDKIK